MAASAELLVLFMSVAAVRRARSENAGVYRVRLRSFLEARPDRAGGHSAELGGSRSHCGRMESTCQSSERRPGKPRSQLEHVS